MPLTYDQIQVGSYYVVNFEMHKPVVVRKGDVVYALHKVLIPTSNGSEGLVSINVEGNVVWCKPCELLQYE